MFCMGCGAEIRPHARVCAVCGRPVAESPASVVDPSGGRVPSTSLETAPRRPATPLPPPPPVPLARPLAPSIAYGDTRLIGIPRDTVGRLVLVLSLLLAADLFAPWIAFDGAHVAPVHFFIPSLLLMGLFAISAAVAVYTPFRHGPYYAALPVVLGAAAFGAAALLAIVVGPLASPLTNAVVARILDDMGGGFPPTDSFTVPSISLAGDTGLYVFLIGSGILTVAGYQMMIFAASARSIVVSPAIAPQHLAVASAVASADGGAAHGQTSDRSHGDVEMPASALSASSHPAGSADALPAPASAGSVALPGSAEWSRAPDVPNVGRNVPPLRGLTSRGARR
ncbi:MAG TPA: zinc ribbon domain-containing protein [Ktedonobacterales bacterium]